ncbi:hypothetical protein RHGRI_006483 [Rhododendron griersonianum]|uniref:Uncharacterized protein n=1 Tax=Rhododendron griersonianum TaxID=479676 RepID=A0AAV6KTU0_9ERIC|nr:hypothetical protein RHGRI_006483 [Rhododendron griersonianum]
MYVTASVGGDVVRWVSWCSFGRFVLSKILIVDLIQPNLAPRCSTLDGLPVLFFIMGMQQLQMSIHLTQRKHVIGIAREMHAKGFLRTWKDCGIRLSIKGDCYAKLRKVK